MTPMASTVRGIVFVLASWQMDAPAGIERATAALASGLSTAGHRVAIATAAPRRRGEALAGVSIEQLDLPITFPCNDQALREAIMRREGELRARLREIIAVHRADTVVFTDALWGLGRLPGPLPRGVRRVLAAHVLPHIADAPPALNQADIVITPSDVVRAEAAAAGLPSSSWRIVPNALLHAPAAPPDHDAIERRRSAPVRILARLGEEKGLVPLLRAAHGWSRRLEVSVAPAALETIQGAQARVLARCRALAHTAPNVTLIEQRLPWRQVPLWLADASAVIVPSLRETFGLVALEAMSVAVPVICYPVGNLPVLLEHAPSTGRFMGDLAAGPDTLLKAADALLSDPITYRRTATAMYPLAQDYRPDRIAQLFVKAVS